MSKAKQNSGPDKSYGQLLTDLMIAHGQKLRDLVVHNILFLLRTLEPSTLGDDSNCLVDLSADPRDQCWVVEVVGDEVFLQAVNVALGVEAIFSHDSRSYSGSCLELDKRRLGVGYSPVQFRGQDVWFVSKVDNQSVRRRCEQDEILLPRMYWQAGRMLGLCLKSIRTWSAAARVEGCCVWE